MKAASVVPLLLLGSGLLIGGVYITILNAPVTVNPPTRPPMPAENGFLRLQAAAGRLVHTGDIADAVSNRTKPAWTPTQKRELTAANRPALDEARAALRLPYREANTTDSLNDDGNAPGKSLRHLSRALTLAGDAAWESGKQAEAVNWYLDAVTLGRRMPDRVGLQGLRVALVCETIGRSRLWRRLDTMRPPVAAQCLVRLNALAPDRVPLFVAVEEEKWSVQSAVLELMTHPERIRWQADTDNSPSESGVRYGDLVPPRYVMDTIGDYMDKLIAQSKQPYINGNREIPVPKEPIALIFAPVTTGTRCRYAVVETGDALLRTALALRIHRARTGKYPATLAELIAAGLLPAVPVDPFAAPGTALVYRAAPDGKYTLYSTGPDGRDDNGRGIVGTNTKGEESRYVSPESTGDMVAGWYDY